MEKRLRGASANAVSTSDVSTGFDPSGELAGSVETTSLCSSALSPSLSHCADSLWNADTGATAHMTPHRHFFASYMPFRTPVSSRWKHDILCRSWHSDLYSSD